MPSADLTIELEVDGKPLRVEHVEGHAAVSELFRFVAFAQDLERDAMKLDALMGKPFVLKVHSQLGESLVVHGVVGSVERLAAAAGAHDVLELVPAVAPLGVGMDSYAYQDMTVVDIVKDVLASSNVENVEWRAKASYAKRVYTVQYLESDWAFIERICADEGIYYAFEFTEDATKLVFADDSTGAPDVEGGAQLPFKDATQLRADADSVVDVRSATRATSDAVTLNDYDFEKPKLKLDANAKDGPGAWEIYDFPGRYKVPGDGKARAKRLLEALRALRRVVTGRNANTRIRPGACFEITEHPVQVLNAKLFCTSVDWYAQQGAGEYDQGEQRGLEVTWTAIPAKTPFRPEPRGERVMRGAQTGIVAGTPGEEVHTNEHGQIRVQFYWDRAGKKDDKAGTFMRVGQFALGNSMIIPRVGWDQIVEHHAGDVDQPFIVSHLYDGEHPTPYSLPGNKTRTSWQTATTPGDGSSNEIRFEDKAGSEELFINASKDMAVTVGDNVQVKVGANHTHEIGANHDIKVGSNAQLGVTGDQQVKIGAVESLKVSGTRVSGISGSDSQTIGAARVNSVSKGRSVEANGGRSLTVGGAMMQVSAMAVSRAVLGSTSVTVGGAWISAAAVGLGNATAGAAAETVGGAKLQAAGGGVVTAVKGALAETVGGAYISNAGGDVGENAQGPLAVDVGGAFLANGPTITIEAESEIKITVGGSSLTITGSSVEVKAPSLASPGATIAKNGSAVHHNP